MMNVMYLLKSAGPKMVPFLKTVIIYFVVGASAKKDAIWSTVLKCAPIICLMIFILLNGMKLSTKYKYSQLIFIGLIFSCIGDALLNHNLFPFGMASFGVAQCFYITAFKFLKPLRIWIGLLLYTIGGICISFIYPNLEGVLLYGLPIYSILLLTMAWRAIARIDNTQEFQQLTCAVGAILFVISDSMIALNLFYISVPYAQYLIMITYYAAQFGITLSVINAKQD